jgi:hypothetical protein
LSAAPADCHSGAQLAVTFDGFNDYSGLIDLLPSSQPYYLRLCIWDEAGNLNDATVISGMTNNQHRIFVSSGLFSASLQQDYLNINNGAAFVSGLAGADARCQHLANEAQLGGSFKAVLSDDGISAKARLTDYGPVVNMNPAGSERVSDSIAALVNIPTSNDKVIYGETGTAYLAEIAWTGTKADGSSQPGMSCMNWSSTASENDGYVGLTGSKTSKWITFFPFGCDLPARLYCIEQFP